MNENENETERDSLNETKRMKSCKMSIEQDIREYHSVGIAQQFLCKQRIIRFR